MPDAPSPPALPPEDGDAPLESLSRDHLSVFLFVAFTPDELLELVKRLGITIRGGYRPERISDVERADLLADEIREVRGRRKQVLDRLREILGGPALSRVTMTPPVARELADAVIEDGAVARFLWRVLADPDPAVRKAAGPALDRLLRAYYPPPEGEAPKAEQAGRKVAPLGDEPLPAPAKGGAPKAGAELAKLRKETAKALRERDKTAAQVERLREQLKEARAAEADATRDAAAARKAATAAEKKRAALEAQLAAAKGKGAAAEAARLRRELKDAEGRVHELEALVGRLEREKAEAPAAVPVATAATAAPRPAPAPEAAADELEEAPASWLMPVYTREFYDSLDGWDRRIQRAAFKQAHLLAQDHRHPSLRALPLEGLENLYRVRVATDVRLLYRRGEGNRVEILSLIDREDLDRYIKQAKER